MPQQPRPHAGLALGAAWERIAADFRAFRFTWRGFWRWTGITLAALLAAILITLYFLDWNQLRGPIGRWASQHYGREVRIDGDLRVRLFRWQPSIDVGGLVSKYGLPRAIRPAYGNDPTSVMFFTRLRL